MYWLQDSFSSWEKEMIKMTSKRWKVEEIHFQISSKWDRRKVWRWEIESRIQWCNEEIEKNQMSLWRGCRLWRSSIFLKFKTSLIRTWRLKRQKIKNTASLPRTSPLKVLRKTFMTQNIQKNLGNHKKDIGNSSNFLLILRNLKLIFREYYIHELFCFQCSFHHLNYFCA